MASGGGQINFDFKGVAPDRLTTLHWIPHSHEYALDLMGYEEKRSESWKKVRGVNHEGMREERMGYEHNQNVLCDIPK